MKEDYLSQIEAILGSPIQDDEIQVDLQWNSVKEARQHIRQINQMKKELRLVRKNIRQVMKEIRVSFREKKADVKAGFLASIWWGAARVRESQRKELRREERASLARYESLLLLIDKALVKLDGLKLELETWIGASK